MLYILTAVAIVFFATHVILLLASFTRSGFATSRYFYSHLTLWLTGGVVLLAALIYSGTNQSQFLDYFNTPVKKALILAFTFGLSLVAHLIVRFLILPLFQKNKV